MADVIFVHPDDLDTIIEKTGQPPAGAVRVVATQLVARGQVYGPLPEPSFANLYSAAPALEMPVDDGDFKWPMRPSLSQYIPRIEHGPRFVPESNNQRHARTMIAIFLAIPSKIMRRCPPGKRRTVRQLMWPLLDANYVHPKRKRHG